MNLTRLRADALAGLTTSFALLPECIAFALVAHLNPLMGLYGAFIICTLTALFGGRPGMVSGAAGSMAVVIVALVVQHGVEYLLATVLLGGLIMVAFGLLRLGKLVRMVPHSVMLGFVNGLAIIIALAQLEHFKSGEHWLSGTPLYVMIGLVLVTMAIVYLLAWFTLERTRYGRHIYAVGGNAEAAGLAGVRVKRIITSVYVIAGGCAGLAGVIFAARVISAQPTAGTGYELDAIAAVVLGGTSLAGGRGRIVGTLIGSIILGVLSTGLILMNVPFFTQLLIKGVVIILAVAIDSLKQRQFMLARLFKR